MSNHNIEFPLNISEDQTIKEDKIDCHLDLDPDKAITAKFIEPRYSQPCLLCDNTREIPHPRHYYYPWVCDECKEAIVFVKELKHKQKTFDPLKPILD